MTVRTAICRDIDTNAEMPVQCKVATNWHGSPCNELTLRQLAEDHPNLKFVGWVYDMNNPEDINSLRLGFLSPNVFAITKWVWGNGQIEYRKIYREEV